MKEILRYFVVYFDAPLALATRNYYFSKNAFYFCVCHTTRPHGSAFNEDFKWQSNKHSKFTIV